MNLLLLMIVLNPDVITVVFYGTNIQNDDHTFFRYLPYTVAISIATNLKCRKLAIVAVRRSMQQMKLLTC